MEFYYIWIWLQVRSAAFHFSQIDFNQAGLTFANLYESRLHSNSTHTVHEMHLTRGGHLRISLPKRKVSQKNLSPMLLNNGFLPLENWSKWRRVWHHQMDEMEWRQARCKYEVGKHYSFPVFLSLLWKHGTWVKGWTLAALTYAALTYLVARRIPRFFSLTLSNPSRLPSML